MQHEMRLYKLSTLEEKGKSPLLLWACLFLLLLWGGGCFIFVFAPVTSTLGTVKQLKQVRGFRQRNPRASHLGEVSYSLGLWSGS